MSINEIKDIISIITNLGMLILGCTAFFSFRYRFDNNIRDLYYKHYLKLKTALESIQREKYISCNSEHLIDDAYNEATLYLEDSVRKIATDIWCYKQDYLYNTYIINNTESKKDEKEQARNQIRDINEKFSLLLDNLSFVYRKHFVVDHKIYQSYSPTFYNLYFLLFKSLTIKFVI